jgi:hypothetical protein
MATTTANLVQGPATLYFGAFGAVEPVDAVAVPASAVWKDAGATKDGVNLTIEQEYVELEVDQLADIPGQRLVKRTITIETNLAENTLENLKNALNGGTTTATSYTPGTGALSGAEPTYSALVIDGVGPSGKNRRIFVRKVLSTDNVEFSYAKGDQSVYAVTFTAHYVSSSIDPFKIIDAP